MTSATKVLTVFPKAFAQPRNSEARAAFRERLASALRRRLAPNTALAKVQLAAALGVATQTLDNWCARQSQPDGYLLTQLIRIFDAGFANEVFGGAELVVAKLDDMRRFTALREVNRSAKALEAIDAALAETEVA